MNLNSVLGVLPGAKVAWHKAQIDAYYREEEWRVKRGLAAELAKMRACRRVLDELKREAAGMISGAPWSRDIVAELLNQRMQALKQVAESSAKPARDHWQED